MPIHSTIHSFIFYLLKIVKYDLFYNYNTYLLDLYSNILFTTEIILFVCIILIDIILLLMLVSMCKENHDLRVYTFYNKLPKYMFKSKYMDIIFSA